MSDSPASLIARFEAGGRLVKYATSGLTPAQAETPIAPGTMSILQLVIHLLDADLAFAHRMKCVIAEDEPVLQSFDEDAFLAKLPATNVPLGEAVELFAEHRRWTARILHRCQQSDFARAGMHTEKGRQTLVDIVGYATGHVDHHLRFLYAKRGALGCFIEARYAPEPVLKI